MTAPRALDLAWALAFLVALGWFGIAWIAADLPGSTAATVASGLVLGRGLVLRRRERLSGVAGVAIGPAPAAPARVHPRPAP